MYTSRIELNLHSSTHCDERSYNKHHIMSKFNPQSSITLSVIASDLDGTLIPLPKMESNRKDLLSLSKHLNRKNLSLIFATGRHFESVLEAMSEYPLPQPDWIVCDVGSAIYKRHGNEFIFFKEYESHLEANSTGLDRTVIEQALHNVAGIELQPPDHQQRFKISYQSQAQKVDQLVETIRDTLKISNLPYDCMGSVDPFLNCGLIDVMPKGVSKAYALIWLSKHANFTAEQVVFAGDSGNDYAALVSGFHAIIVANGSDTLKAKVKAQLKEQELDDRLYIAQHSATSGVLEGCQHFGLF
jgi:sucrose-6F-phosphate phosphohydrolase